MACLVWDSPGGRKVFELDRAVMVLGRDPVSDIHLPDATVSRRHALLQVDGDRVRITDLGSTSSTRINGAALVRDIPSTLEAGDFLHLGKLELTFHTTPPPAPKPAVAPAPAKPKPEPRPKPKTEPKPAARAPKRERAAARARKPETAPASGSGGPWKMVAVGLAFVVVALLGAFLALHGQDREQPVVITEPPDTGPEAGVEQKMPDERKPETATETAPAPETGRKPEPGAADAETPEPDAKPAAPRAPAGTLPPAGNAPVEDCPDLLEVDGKRYFAVAVVSFDKGGVDVRGRDGRIYGLARREVTRILDRADLVRRIAAQRLGLPAGDVAQRLALATWCAERYAPVEARQLVDEVLALSPGNEQAEALRARLQEER